MPPDEIVSAPGNGLPPVIPDAVSQPLAQPAPAPAALPAETAPVAVESVAVVADAKPEPAVVVPEPAKEPGTTAERPSLLEKAGAEEKPAPAEGAKTEPAKADAKPADAQPADAKPAEAKPVEAAKVDVPALDPVEYKYEVPEIIQIDDAQRASLHAALDKFRANPAEGAQDLLNMHADTMSAYAAHLSAEQHRAFNATRDQWNVDWKADPVIGGAGYETSLKTIARMRDALVPKAMLEPSVTIGEDAAGKPIKISEFEQFLRVTGAGDHPVFARILHSAARFADEPQHESLPTNPRPVPNNGRAPGSRREVLYDHPSSQRRT